MGSIQSKMGYRRGEGDSRSPLVPLHADLVLADPPPSPRSSELAAPSRPVLAEPPSPPSEAHSALVADLEGEDALTRDLFIPLPVAEPPEGPDDFEGIEIFALVDDPPPSLDLVSDLEAPSDPTVSSSGSRPGSELDRAQAPMAAAQPSSRPPSVPPPAAESQAPSGGRTRPAIRAPSRPLPQMGSDAAKPLVPVSEPGPRPPRRKASAPLPPPSAPVPTAPPQWSTETPVRPFRAPPRRSPRPARAVTPTPLPVLDPSLLVPLEPDAPKKTGSRAQARSSERDSASRPPTRPRPVEAPSRGVQTWETPSRGAKTVEAHSRGSTTVKARSRGSEAVEARPRKAETAEARARPQSSEPSTKRQAQPSSRPRPEAAPRAGGPPTKKRPRTKPSTSDEGVLAPRPRGPTSPRRDPSLARKAEGLYSLAMAEASAGDVTSARRHLQLALVFDPGSYKYRHALTDLGKNPPESRPSSDRSAAPNGPAKAASSSSVRATAASSPEEESAVRALDNALSTDTKPPPRRRLRDLLIRRK